MYQDDGQIASPSPNLDPKEILDIMISIKKQINQIKNCEQLQETEKNIVVIEQQSQINLDPDEKQKTPSLSMNCETHNTEIIMLNLNQAEFEQKNPFLCVECVQDSLIGGNKAVSNYISLKEANKRWKKYLEEQNERRCLRQTRFSQAIAIIKKLQEKYNQELCKIIQSLNDQLIKQPKGYEELLRLKNISLFQQEKQSLHYIIEILGQTEKQKNQEQVQNQEDSKFYQTQKKLLEELIKENLLVENQLQWLQNYDQQPQKSNDVSKEKIENDSEVIEFLKKTTIQDQYLSFFEISFNSLKTFKQEEYDLKQKGKLNKLQQSDMETQSEQIQIYQKWYKQFQDNQTKLEKLMKVDEIEKNLVLVEQEKQQILMKDEENKKIIQQLNDELDDQKEQLKKQLVEYQDRDNKNQIKEKLQEIQQIYSIVKVDWQKGETQLLSKEYAQKIYQTIEQKTQKKIKNKYLIYSQTETGLNQKTLWNSIDKMSNLLMIFKSKSQYIFGGFSPCQWLQCSTSYHTDQTLSSFLFSQTQNQIYPIIPSNSGNAIYFDGSYFCFGYQDMRISQDFQQGSSNLGTTYQCSQYSIPNKQNHLFGQSTPNIMQCEIVMLTFN